MLFRSVQSTHVVCTRVCVFLVEQSRMEGGKDLSALSSSPESGSGCSGFRNTHSWAPTVCAGLSFPLHHNPGGGCHWLAISSTTAQEETEPGQRHPAARRRARSGTQISVSPANQGLPVQWSLPSPAGHLSKNLEEYFWNEVSNTPSHFY